MVATTIIPPSMIRLAFLFSASFLAMISLITLSCSALSVRGALNLVVSRAFFILDHHYHDQLTVTLFHQISFTWLIVLL